MPREPSPFHFTQLSLNIMNDHPEPGELSLTVAMDEGASCEFNLIQLSAITA